MLRELITRPIQMVVSLLDLPRTMERSMREANQLMEISREQLETMRRQADEALVQAERMNELLARVVKLTEPIERAQRGGEYVGERLKRVLLGEEKRAEEVDQAAERAQDAAEAAEVAAEDAEVAAEDAEVAVDQAEEKADEVAEASEADGGVEVVDGGTIRVIPTRKRPEEDEPEK